MSWCTTIFDKVIPYVALRRDIMADSNSVVLAKIQELYNSLFDHDGYGELKVEMRILKKGQKEVIIHCGKQYRYVVDWQK